MAQAEYLIEDQSGASFLVDINSILDAIKTINSGGTAPTDTEAGMLWGDTSNASTYYLKQRNNDDTAWVTLFIYDVATQTIQPAVEEQALKTFINNKEFFPSTQLTAIGGETSVEVGDNTDVAVYKNGTLLTITTDYTLNGDGVTIDLVVALSASDFIQAWEMNKLTTALSNIYTKTEIDEKAQLWQNQATPITPDADSDYTPTADENKYGRLVLADGSWLSGHNIIIDNTERSLLVDNSAGTYTATVKTSAGTGIPVTAGTKVWLLCDGTNVEVSIDAEVTWVANDSRAKTALNASGTAPIYACRAWVNFNGTGTVAIGASGNVSSITDNGVGDYKVNFITAMVDTNYAVTTSDGDRFNNASEPTNIFPADTGHLTSSIRIISVVPGSSVKWDVANISVSIFR